MPAGPGRSPNDGEGLALIPHVLGLAKIYNTHFYLSIYLASYLCIYLSKRSIHISLYVYFMSIYTRYTEGLATCRISEVAGMGKIKAFSSSAWCAFDRILNPETPISL